MKLEKLTPEQEQLMYQVRDEWINLALKENVKGINKPLFKEGVEWLYTDLLKKPNPKIVYCDSWLSCLITISIFKKLTHKQIDKLGASVRDSVWDSVRASVRDSVGASVGDSVRDSVWASVWDSVRASVRDSVGDSVGDSVRDSVGDSVWASVWDSVRASVRDSVGDSVGDSVWDSVRASVRASVRDSVGDSVGDSVWDSVGDSVWASVRDSVWDDLKNEFNNYSNYNGFTNYGWVSFYDFFERINVLDNFKFKQYKKLIKSNCFNAYEYENYVFAIQPPITIIKNETNQLNSVEKAAIEFKDGSKYYYVQGRNLSEELFNKLKEDKYTMEDFTKEDDEEIKSACVSFMQQVKGDDYIVSFFKDNLKEIDTFVDKKDKKYLEGTTNGMNVGVYTLFKGEINGTNIAYVRCFCPSSDRLFFLGVSSEYNNAKDAIASLYRIPRKLKKHITHINRQGERFSTNFTNEGLSLLKTLPKSDIEDLVNISGTEYFSKIKYEF